MRSALDVQHFLARLHVHARLRVTPASAAVFSTVISVVVLYPASLTLSKSTVTSVSPAFTRWLALTATWKPSPFIFTVSMPTCTSTSMPSSVFRPKA